MTLNLSGNDSCLARNLKGRFGLNQIGWRDVKPLMQIPHIGIQVILIPETREASLRRARSPKTHKELFTEYKGKVREEWPQSF